MRSGLALLQAAGGRDTGKESSYLVLAFAFTYLFTDVYVSNTTG